MTESERRGEVEPVTIPIVAASPEPSAEPSSEPEGQSSEPEGQSSEPEGQSSEPKGQRVIQTSALASPGRGASGVSRRALVGGVGAMVAVVLVVAAMLALGGDAEDPPSAAPTSTTIPASPAATRPSSRDGAGSSGEPTSQGSCTQDCETATTEQASRSAPVGAIEDPGDGDGGSSPTGPLLGAAGLLLAVGVLRELRRRRSRPPRVIPKERDSRPARPVSIDRELPDSAGEPADRADDTKADRVGAALVHLANNLRPCTGSGCPQPRVVRVRDGLIDVLLNQPDPSPPAPWRPEASGMSWVLGADTALPETGEALPLPALVTVGSSESDVLVNLKAYGTIGTSESDILVDLEAYGVVALVGDQDACRGMARAMAAELSIRPEGEVVVEVVGDPFDDVTAGLDRVDRRASWKKVDTAIVDTCARLLDTGGWPHTWAARASGRIPDAWVPTVWITEASHERRYLDALDTIAARPGAGAVLVVVGDDPGRGLRIHLDDSGRFEIPDLALRGIARTRTPTAAAT